MTASPSKPKRDFPRPLDLRRGRIDLSHGGGGRAMAQLIEELFVAAFANPWLARQNDQACFEPPPGRLVMTTDSFVVAPLFFPGGDIGSLAVHGTINDIAMAGARPLHLAAAFILEEGLALADLDRIVRSMAEAARDAGVAIVTGDTKVVERGKGDGVFITTTGIGVVPEGVEISAERARPGDAVLLSGAIGDHGVAVMAKRSGIELETTVTSDSAGLHGLVAAMVAAGADIRCLRDPTRGGLATVLNELARQSGVGIEVRESAIPVRAEVAGACELLGLDPLYVANEGKLVAICAAEDAERLLSAMRAHPLGGDAAIIGAVIEDPNRFVRMVTTFGGVRVVDWLSGEQLPPDLLSVRILFLTHSFNGLAQRLWVELSERGHEVSVELDINDAVTIEAVELFRPDLIVAPLLKRRIPEQVWQRHVCLVVHPGPVGDRGPSSLDWAILRDETRWGVTCLQADAELDAGPVWASAGFAMREAAKSSLYRREVTEAAVQTVLEAIERIGAGADRRGPAAMPRTWRPLVRQVDRAIDWLTDDSATVLAKIRSADGQPGVADQLFGEPCHLYDAHPETRLRGEPGALIARRHGGLCRATVDGAVWIGQVKRPPPAGERGFKLPAALAFRDQAVDLPDLPLAPEALLEHPTWREITYQERGPVGHLSFDFYNGAMSMAQCRRLLAAYDHARARPTRVIVLWGGAEFWSNGMNLAVIEAAASPAEESWRNIDAIDDLARAIITTGDQITIAALCGNAGAGGVFLALAADRVIARGDVVLNPHYRNMGNLYGSEYWTYLLPKRVGADRAAALTGARLPLGARAARRMGLLDAVVDGDHGCFRRAIEAIALDLAKEPGCARLLAEKRRNRVADEAAKPLEAYRGEELERMRLNFFGFDPSYHVARYNFVTKVPHSRTPLYLARHRQRLTPMPAD